MADLRERALFAGVHAALLAAIWLFAADVYAVAFAAPSPAWLAIDLVFVAAALAFIHRHRDRLGLASLGDRRFVKLVGIVAVATACVLATHALITDTNQVWLDESNYLATLRAGRILRNGVAPFNVRWLEPLLAGPLNILPVADATALKALNFGAFVVTAAYLALLLVRLRVRYVHALAAPVFLLCSYLGRYGASNRLLVDPFNYAMFVLLFHVLVDREHWRYFPFVLLVAAFNSEKAIYWVPLFAVIALLERRRFSETARLVVRCGAPAMIYLIAIALYVRGSSTEDAGGFTQNLHVMAFTPLGAKITNATVRGNTFQMLWFPFGAFTIYALLALQICERRLRVFALLLVPVLLQALIAHDTPRMVAYAFIVYLPLGYLYLATVLRAFPRQLAEIVFALLVLLAIAQSYLFPLASLAGLALPVAHTRLYLAAAELILAGGIVMLHALVYSQARS